MAQWSSTQVRAGLLKLWKFWGSTLVLILFMAVPVHYHNQFGRLADEFDRSPGCSTPSLGTGAGSLVPGSPAAGSPPPCTDAPTTFVHGAYLSAGYWHGRNSNPGRSILFLRTPTGRTVKVIVESFGAYDSANPDDAATLSLRSGSVMGVDLHDRWYRSVDNPDFIRDYMDFLYPFHLFWTFVLWNVSSLGTAAAWKRWNRRWRPTSAVGP